MRAVCIHGHFYQPPRENPWVGVVGRQRSARPFHDWNERITAECYAPNAEARVLEAAGSRRVSNYRQLSFDVGPTLHEWLAVYAPEVDRAIVDAGRRRGALAQAYNHVILPLADDLTKELQVRWGVRDFEHRFGRAPEGLWLPETAVDTPTLEVLARHGIRFAIVAPHQIARVREPGGERWTATYE
jgi:alpha-amylase/alpha-mannosidase (GH57 family)